MSLVIRSAKPADVPEIAQIYNEAVGERTATAETEPRSLEERREWFKQFDERYPIWVGTLQDRVTCYGALIRYSPKAGYRFATENMVYVARDARGQGHGRAMLAHVLAEARRLGFKYVLARIFTHNPASLALHARLGFRELGLQRKIVEMDERWYDVTLMDLSL